MQKCLFFIVFMCLSASVKGQNYDLPPNAEAGKCYEKCFDTEKKPYWKEIDCDKLPQKQNNKSPKAKILNLPKKEYYYNQDWKQITKKDFEDYSLYKGYRFRIEKDSIILNKFEYRYEHGILHSDSLTRLRDYLKQISNRDLPEKGTIVINYYPGADKCNLSGGSKGYYKNKFKKYSRRLDKFENISQFFIYKSQENLNKYKSKYAIWHKDERSKIQQTFFKFHYPCGSYVVIAEDGAYLINKGEYPIEAIYESIKSFKK